MDKPKFTTSNPQARVVVTNRTLGDEWKQTLRIILQQCGTIQADVKNLESALSYQDITLINHGINSLQIAEKHLEYRISWLKHLLSLYENGFSSEDNIETIKF